MAIKIWNELPISFVNKSIYASLFLRVAAGSKIKRQKNINISDIECRSFR